MPISVKVCRTRPLDEPNGAASVRQQTVSPGGCLVRQQLTQGSFGLFPLRLNPNLLCFDPNLSYFSQFKPKNMIKTYQSQIIKPKLRKLEAREEKKGQEP